MKSKIVPAIATSLFAAPSLLFADTITMTGATGSVWTDVATWSDGLAPAAANDYVVSGKTLNAPSITTTAAVAFAGKSLSVTNGGLSFPGSSGGNVTHTYNFPNLTGPIQVADSTLTFASSNSTTKAFNAALNFSGNNVITRTSTGFTHNQNFNNPITGSGNLTFNFTGGGTGRAVNINGTANNFTGAVILNNTEASGGTNPPLNINQPLGAASYEIRNRWNLVNAVAGGINSAGSITLVHAASQLTLTQPWNNPAASLALTNGIVLVGNAPSVIGSLSGAAGSIQGNGVSSALTVTQGTDATYAGAIGITTGNALSFTKEGPADLKLTGTLNTAVPFTIANGGLGFGSATIGSLTQSGGEVLIDLGTSSNDHPLVSGNYTVTGGGLGIRITSPPALDTPYTLLSYQGTLTGTPAVNFEGLGGSRVTPAVSYGSGSSSAISVTFSGEAANLTWKGVPNGNWDVDSSGNWGNGSSADKFYQFDHAIFDDSATGTTSVTLNEVVTPGSVIFNNSTKNYTLSGSGGITGVAEISKSGTGAVTIATDNTHTGLNTILDGTLRIGSGGTVGSLGTGEVANEGLLEFNRSDVFTFPNVISGGGSIAQVGSGTTILTADNSYSGSTTVSSGTLQVGAGGATGSLGFTGAVVNNGTLAFNRSGSVIVPSEISGSGSLIQNGPGTTILESDAIYTGGTTINGGTLQLGNTGVAGSVVGTVTNNGNLAVNRADDIDFATTVTGTGSFTHAGIGTLRLTGTKTYTGETRVMQGILKLDTGSKIPAGGSFAFAGGNGMLQIADAALTTLPSFRAVGTGGGANIIESATPITVTGGNLLVGPDADSSHFLDLSFIPSFTYNSPVNIVSLGSQSANGGTRSATMILPETTSLTASAVNLQTANGATPANNTPIASATLQLGADTSIHADTLNMGFNRDNATINLSGASLAPSLTLRATDGTGRMNINMGNRGTAYGATQSITIDLITNSSNGSTLDAKVGALKIGDYGRGLNQIQNASFLMGGGTLDATSITLGSIYNNNGNNGVLNSTLTVDGGSVISPAVNFGSKTNGTLNSKVDLYGGATLSSTVINAGPGVANRVLNLSEGTLSNIAGDDLLVSGIKVLLETMSDASLQVAAGDAAIFGAGTTFEFRYDSGLPEIGTLAVTGAMQLDAGVALAIADDNIVPAPFETGDKLVLVQYSAGSFTGAFSDSAGNPLADGSLIVVGSQPFVLDYNDPAYGGKAVTLTVPETSSYAGWAGANAGGGLPDGDFDQDGVSNAVEFFMGETGSSFTPNPSVVSGKITWPKDQLAQATYEVQTSTSLAPEGQEGGWTKVTAGVVDTGSSVQYTLPTTGPKSFVRLKVILP